MSHKSKRSYLSVIYNPLFFNYGLIPSVKDLNRWFRSAVSGVGFRFYALPRIKHRAHMLVLTLCCGWFDVISSSLFLFLKWWLLPA